MNYNSHYKINPCKAVMQKIKNANCDINTMNDLCYGISSAYGDVYGSELKDKLDQQCAELISEQKCVLGKNDCYLKRPVPPPRFNQIPHFFPKLFKESKPGSNPQQSYETCCSMCDNSRYPNSCRENCRLDADAITTGGSSSIEGYRGKNKCCKTTTYVLVLLVSIAFIIFLLMCLKN